MNIRFETERLIIRDIEPEDLDALLQVYTKKENMKYVSDGNYRWTFGQLSDKYEKFNRNLESGFGVFVVVDKETKDVIGESGLFDTFGKQSKLELGYIIDFKYWNKGFGYEICEGLINYCFYKLGSESVIARMYAENISSVKLSEKCGMHRTDTGLTEKNQEYYEYEITKPLRLD